MPWNGLIGPLKQADDGFVEEEDVWTASLCLVSLSLSLCPCLSVSLCSAWALSLSLPAPPLCTSVSLPLSLPPFKLGTLGWGANPVEAGGPTTDTQGISCSAPHSPSPKGFEAAAFLTPP